MPSRLMLAPGRHRPSTGRSDLAVQRLQGLDSKRQATTPHGDVAGPPSLPARRREHQPSKHKLTRRLDRSLSARMLTWKPRVEANPPIHSFRNSGSSPSPPLNRRIPRSYRPPLRPRQAGRASPPPPTRVLAPGHRSEAEGVGGRQFRCGSCYSLAASQRSCTAALDPRAAGRGDRRSRRNRWRAANLGIRASAG